jgi:hypothetical protein
MLMNRIPSLAAAAVVVALLPGCFPYALSTSAPMVHVTLFKFKQGTPVTVTEDFLRDAQSLLVPIPVVKGMWAGRPAPPPAQFQAVAIQDYDIGLAVMVEHAQALEEYFVDQR